MYRVSGLIYSSTRIALFALLAALLSVLGGCTSSASSSASSAQTTSVETAAQPSITIYHLEGRRSERIVWLLEELGLPYDLVFERGDLRASMAKIREVNPDIPMAPTVIIDGQVLVESGAIVELIINRYGDGRLKPELATNDYANYLMWMHFAEGSLAARLFSDYRAWRKHPPEARSRLVDSEATVQHAENFLTNNRWFAGAEFSGADIMMMFPLNVATTLNIVDAAQFPQVAAWKVRVQERPAYQRMLSKARPDGMIGELPKLKQHAPSGPRD